MAWVRTRFLNYKKGALESGRKWYSLPAACTWSVVISGIPASSTTKTGRHGIAEILLKVVIKHQKSINQSIELSRWVGIPITGLTP